VGNTQDEIRNRLLAAIPESFDKTEGSFFYDAIMPAAIELALAYAQADKNLQLGFAQTTNGEYLDCRADEHGLTRRTAVKATGQVTITGTNGTVVLQGSLFATGAGVQFQTVAQVSIDITGQVIANVEAVIAGSAGNVPVGAINILPVMITGVSGVMNAQATTGGVDIETDDDLLTRLLDKVRLPATSGNANHYKQWAMEVPGVGNAKVFPLWNGNGTVKVVVIASNTLPAGPDLIEDVMTHIETMRPIGALVTVEPAQAIQVNITASVTIATGSVLGNVQAAFVESLTQYYESIAFVEPYISYARIGALLLSTLGVTDYHDLLVNGGTVNVDLGEEGVPVSGLITLGV